MSGKPPSSTEDELPGVVRMLKNVKYKREISSQTSSTIIFLDGLSHGYDLQTGLLSLGALLLLIIRGQTLSFHNPNDNCFLDLNRILQHCFMFALNAKVTISKDIYKPQFFNLLKEPIATKIRLLSFKKARFVYELVLTIPGFLDPVARFKVLGICVSKETRKPSPFPEWWQKKYRSFYGETYGSHFKDFVKPDLTSFKGVETRPYTITVPRRDNDWNGHTNGTMYAQYCLDALEHHLLSKNIDCDINTVSLLMKTGHGIHYGESTMGDTLSVVFWEDVTDPDTVCFIITKSGQFIFKGRIQFYGQSEVFGVESKL